MAALDTMERLIELGKAGRINDSVFAWMLEGLCLTTNKGSGSYSAGMLKVGAGVQSLNSGGILEASVPVVEKVVAPAVKPVASTKKPAAPKK